eukprot:COSAG02_NODE_17131_length_1026_cov_1.259978_2_plen_126_part_00
MYTHTLSHIFGLARPDNAGTKSRQNGMVEAIEQNRSNPAESSSSTVIPYYMYRYRYMYCTCTQYRTGTMNCTGTVQNAARTAVHVYRYTAGTEQYGTCIDTCTRSTIIVAATFVLCVHTTVDLLC